MAKLPDAFIPESKHGEANGSFQGLQAAESGRMRQWSYDWVGVATIHLNLQMVLKFHPLLLFQESKATSQAPTTIKQAARAALESLYRAHNVPAPEYLPVSRSWERWDCFSPYLSSSSSSSSQKHLL
ncbi:hypothetical protein MUK42_36872 [Musa troglodytarum]|uniref:Uncharacterized protein n=1 Tax=Musa troglodytarum TaxID=320322 RepID=A0A9E7GDW4_9LILI|nr:hypothetical protein MUK42_36872 [Musa troglodytarum]